MTPKPRRAHPMPTESTLRLYGLLLRLEGEIELDPTVRELVKIRASQINRCAVWDEAADLFQPDELAHLVFAITAINSWNRLTITMRSEGGRYASPPLGEAA